MLGTVLKEKRLRGRRAHRVDTKEQILDSAETLLRGRGYNAFSYKHVATELGIRNAAIHYHFPAKEDLGRELISRYRSRFEEWSKKIELDTTDPWQLLQGYFEICRDYLECDGKVCPGGILGPEYDSIPDSMRNEVQLMMREIYTWLITVLSEGQRTKSLRFVGSPEDKALQIGASLQGAVQIARLTENDRFHRVVKQLELELRP